MPCRADIIGMAPIGFLACGPSGEIFLILGAMALGGLVLTVSFIIGFICLFTSKWKLGVWLTAIPSVIGAVAYLLAQQPR